MSIFIIRGPEVAGALIRTAMPLPAPVLKSLVHRAIDAGTSVAIRACGSEQELLDALRVADQMGLPQRVSRFVLTVGATANQNGTALFEGVTVISSLALAVRKLTLKAQ